MEQWKRAGRLGWKLTELRFGCTVAEAYERLRWKLTELRCGCTVAEAWMAWVET